MATPVIRFLVTVAIGFPPIDDAGHLLVNVHVQDLSNRSVVGAGTIATGLDPFKTTPDAVNQVVAAWAKAKAQAFVSPTPWTDTDAIWVLPIVTLGTLVKV